MNNRHRFVCILLLLLLSVSSYAFTNGQFSNLIVFGDSASDVGNHPQMYTPTTTPLLIFKHSQAALDSLQPLFYVPVSNPVNNGKNGFSIPITEIYKIPNHSPYAWPKDNPYLPVQVPILQSDGKFKNRRYRSFVWDQFFLADAYQDHLTLSQYMIPWVTVETGADNYQPSINNSIDYAWASAISSSQCVLNDGNYTPLSYCDVNSILVARTDYINDVTDPNAWTNIQIPGLLQQIQLFLDDVNVGKVKVGPDTIYTIWIGGNDLLSGVKNELHTEEMLNTMVKNTLLAIDTLIDTPTINAQHILLINLPDPTYMPSLYTFNFLQKLLIRNLINRYNDELRVLTDEVNLSSDAHIVNYVDVHNWFRQVVKGELSYADYFPKSKFGVACQTTNTDYNSAKHVPSANCQYYMYWNGIHPTSPIGQLTGYLVENDVASLIATSQPQENRNPQKHPLLSQQQQMAWLREQLALSQTRLLHSPVWALVGKQANEMKNCA